ncbi:hypothetical protein FACS189492_0270 [Clostridia bacterium]|nr:hypothetical protein FACS189492_0270 [Clostridia bacterium]
MKHKIALAILIAVCLATPTFAADDPSQLLLTEVARVLEIPSYYDGTLQAVQQTEQGVVYELAWNANGGADEKGGYFFAQTSASGQISYYNHYDYGSFDGDYKLSQLDYDGAVKLAARQIERVRPDIAGKVAPLPRDNYHIRSWNSFSLIFYRFEGGVPFYENYVSIQIRAYENTVSEFGVVWDDGLTFPEASGVIERAQAEAQYRKNAGMTKGYYDDARGVPALQYRANFSGKYINAFTGEITDTGVSNDLDDSPGLFPKIRYAEEKTDWLIPPEQLESEARSRARIDPAYTWFRTNLYTDEKGDYCYWMDFGKSGGALGASRTASVLIRVLTKEILYYSNGVTYDEDQRIGVEKAYDAAMAAVKLMAPERLASCAQSRAADSRYVYTFTWPRMLNGMEYANNGISVSVDKSTGEVVTLASVFEARPFPSAATGITAAGAYDALFVRIDYRLQYVKTPSAKQGVTLVYGFAPGAPQIVNARDGALCHTDGAPYTADLKAVYADVEGGDAVETLRSLGITPAETLFRPDENITQADFLRWLNSASSRYVSMEYDADSYLYDSLVARGVLTYDEAAPTAAVTVGQAIQYIISMIGYKDVAMLGNTYKTTFADEAEIDPALIGFAAIAQGMGIVRGAALSPDRLVTRLEAAELLYNLLTSSGGDWK